MSGSTANVAEQFYQIDRSFKDEAYHEAAKTARQIINKQPDNVQAIMCYLYSQIQLSQWKTCFNFIDTKVKDALEKCTTEERATLSYYKAYCLYRLNREKECLDEIKANGDGSEKWQVLEAQCRYRLHQYSQTSELYSQLLKDAKANGGDSEASLLLTVNLLASYVSADTNPKELDDLLERLADPEDAYELAYNLACAYLSKKDYAKAEQMLTLASSLCKGELGTDDDDTDPELNWMNAQLGYLRQLQGRNGDATEIYEKIMRPVVGGSKNDVTVMATACNNLVTLKPKGSSLFDALKRIRLASKAESLESKLTATQLETLGLNKSIALSNRSKVAEARSVLTQLEQQLGDAFKRSGAAAVGKAVTQYSSGGDGKKEAVNTLKSWLATNSASGDATFVRLSLAGLLAESSATRSEAATILADLGPEVSMGRPEAVRQRFTAHTGSTEEDRDALKKEVNEVLNFWQKRSSGDAAAVLRYVADVATRNKLYDEAAKAWELYNSKVGDSSSTEAVQGLVSALSRVTAPAPESLETATMMVERLVQRSPEAETIEDAIDDVDPEELEEMDVSAGSWKVVASAPTAEGEEIEVKKHHRKRKPRYPKGFDPENPSAFRKPDPERWLPKNERSDYRRKMKKKQMQLMRGPQGVVPAEGENVKTGPSTAQLEASTERQTQHQKRRKNQRKRK